VVDTAGSGYDTVVSVYDTSLTEVACNDDAGGSLQSRAGFTARAGETYLVQVGAYAGVIEPDWDTPELVVTIERGRVTTVRPQPERYSFRGDQADAGTWEDTEDGFRGSDVSLVDGRSGRFSFAEVYVSDYDVRFEEKADGTVIETFTDWWGYGDLPSGAFGRRLSGASVDQDVELWGYSCSGPVIDWDEIGDDPDEWPEYDCLDLGTDTARVDVTWTGVGPTSRFNVRERYVEPWGVWTYRAQGRTRDADVVGGVQGSEVAFDLTGADGGLASISVSESFRPRRR
jgi:hypothetical protein